MQIISKETAEALSSEPWLGISLQSVLEFLKLDCLSVEEADVVRGLVSWAKFQFQKDGGDPENSETTLREKLMPALKEIRFAGLSQTEFAKLSLDELKDVLSGDEKLQIMQSLLIGDFKLLPPSLAQNNPLLKRSKPLQA